MPRLILLTGLANFRHPHQEQSYQRIFSARQSHDSELSTAQASQRG